MKISVIILLSFIGIIDNVVAQKAKVIVTESLFNPSDFKVLDDSNLIISDNTLDYPLYLVDISSDTILSRIKQGNGPGELSTMYKNISVTDNYVFVWDYGRQILNYYDYKLAYKGSKSFSNLGYVYNLIINDESVLSIDSSKDFIKIFNYDSENIIGEKLKNLSLKEHKNLNQFESTALRQAFKIASNGDSFFIANEFTSLVFSVNRDGIKFTTTKPLDIVQEVEDGFYTATDLLYNELCALDIGILGGEVYVLSKGAKADKSIIQKEYNNQINEYIEDFINTNQVFLYKKNGNYIKKFNFEKSVKKIDVYDEQIFYLQTLEGNPSIGIF